LDEYFWFSLLLLVTSGILSLVTANSFSVFVSLLILYGLYLAGGSIYTACKYDWKKLPVLPLVSAIMQLSFGTGFWVGIFRSHH